MQEQSAAPYPFVERGLPDGPPASSNGTPAGGDPLPCLHLCSRRLTPEGAFKMWRATMPQYMISLPEGQAPSSFSIDTCAWLLDPLVIAAGYNSSVNLVRTPPKTLDGHDNIVLLVVCEGSWQGDTEGRPFHLESAVVVPNDAG